MESIGAQAEGNAAASALAKDKVAITAVAHAASEKSCSLTVEPGPVAARRAKGMGRPETAAHVNETKLTDDEALAEDVQLAELLHAVSVKSGLGCVHSASARKAKLTGPVPVATGLQVAAAKFSVVSSEEASHVAP